ncbi:MAG: AbrB/MazE/SpoVT family DNA-binding domain-containing protein [Magnetococcales bacterium]|nr:AbrB/MazE/SpoVT family DNA-binding domain-containing protein [Magnetococcales bacterium]NGZ25507.1 AbrB/MazE/SpoVT family DNA-binding domain-containing protein [Magnetococcales bacterium]
MSLAIVGPGMQVTLPEDVLGKTTIHAGDVLEVSIQEGMILLKPHEQDRATAIRGLMTKIKKPPPGDEFANLTEDDIMELAIQEIAEMRAVRDGQ